MQKNPNDIIIFLIVVSALIICMALFIVVILNSYRKRQADFQISLEQMKLDHEKTLMTAQLEMQEQTFQYISREIHDNISLSLTLAKLYLNTLDWEDKQKGTEKVEASIELLTSSLANLSNISKGLNADIIIQHGLLKAIEDEILRIQKTGLFSVGFKVLGTPVYMDTESELIIFRIIQEGFNNIIKHAAAGLTKLVLHYQPKKLDIAIHDNGNGFDTELAGSSRQAGLKNMEARVKVLKGVMNIKSQPGKGTVLMFTIPIN